MGQIDYILTNCSVANNPQNVPSCGTANIEITADNGYYFDESVYGYYYNCDGDFADFELKPNADGSKLTGTFYDFDFLGEDIEAVAVVKQTPHPKTIDIVLELENCVSDLTGDTLDEDTEVKITFTANEGYKFTSSPNGYYFDDEANYVSFNGSIDQEDETIATLVFRTPLKSAVSYDTIYISADASVIPDTKIDIVINGSNYSTNLVNNKVEEGEQTNIILTANESYKFTGEPSIGYYDYYGNYHGATGVLSNDNKTATIVFNAPYKDDVNGAVELWASVEAVVEYKTRYGAVNVYNVTPEELEEFSKQRYLVSDDGDRVQYDDLGVFVIKLHRTYCGVGDTLPTSLEVAVFDTGIDTKTPVDDVITVDFGTILIPAKSGDISDYNCKISVFLPFLGFTELTPTAIIGKELELVYKVNNVTGQGSASLTVDDVPLVVKSGQMVNSILFRTYDNDIFGSLENEPNVLEGLRPYVIMSTHDTHAIPPYNTRQRDVISTFEGFGMFDDVRGLTAVNMIKDEYNEIISLLNKGVIL